MKLNFVFYSILIFSITSCSLPKYFEVSEQPNSPDYSQEKYWSALPYREDAADDIPKYEQWVTDSLKEVDVFYVYPTLHAKGDTWTADIENKKHNGRIDKLPVRLQASAFNVTGRVYSPRYRQAHVDCYKKEISFAKDVLDFAYSDVKRAFEYYLEHYNQGRPIVIASHSQGTSHTLRLLEDFFDNELDVKKLVCAYIVGMAVDTLRYKWITPCQNPEETNCYVTWSSYKQGYELNPEKDFSEVLVGNICVNPITWTQDNQRATTNSGILLNLSREKTFQTTAEIHYNYLWVKTNTILFKRKKELHLLDYNMFWKDIRENVNLRKTFYFKNVENDVEQN